MKNIILTASIILLLADSSFSQMDSIMFIKEADFSFYRMQKVKYDNSGEIKTEKHITTLEDVNTLTFLTGDSVALSRHGEKPAYISLSNINDVTKYRYRFSPVLGTIIGVVGGGLLGAGIGYIASGNKDTNEGLWLFGGAFFGTLIGGIFGAGITHSINHPTLDLSSVPDKDKKNKLLNFLKQE